jgi:hypothetical protein
MTDSVSYRLWNYNPLNEDSTGDQWNGENFSWFSKFRARKLGMGTLEQSDVTLDDGGRILESIVRPYPAKVAGIPLKFEYDVNRGEFQFEWAKPALPSHDGDYDESLQGGPTTSNPPLVGHPHITSNLTEIFLPSTLVGQGKKFVVALDGAALGSRWWYDAPVQTLFIEQPSSEGIPDGAKYRMIFGLTPQPKAKWPMRTHWEDFAAYYLTFLAFVIGIAAFFLV